MLFLDVSPPQERDLYPDVSRQQACAGLGLSTLQDGYVWIGQVSTVEAGGQAYLMWSMHVSDLMSETWVTVGDPQGYRVTQVSTSNV